VSDGEATDQSKDEAQQKSYGCPRCSGGGQVMVFDRDYDGSRTIERDGVVRGEIKKVKFAAVVSAHCVCPIGRWMRSKTSRDLMGRIPDLADVLAGSGRWVAEDPTADRVYRGPRTVQEMKASLAGRVAK
jgi:hypothetical protein